MKSFPIDDCMAIEGLRIRVIKGSRACRFLFQSLVDVTLQDFLLVCWETLPLDSPVLAFQQKFVESLADIVSDSARVASGDGQRWNVNDFWDVWEVQLIIDDFLKELISNVSQRCLVIKPLRPSCKQWLLGS